MLTRRERTTPKLSENRRFAWKALQGVRFGFYHSLICLATHSNVFNLFGNPSNVFKCLATIFWVAINSFL